MANKARAIPVPGSMILMPTVYVVEGYIGVTRETEYYPCDRFSIEDCRRDFQAKYYAAGVRGVTVSPLYSLGRPH